MIVASNQTLTYFSYALISYMRVFVKGELKSTPEMTAVHEGAGFLGVAAG